LAGIFAILVLVIAKSAPSFAWWSLRIQFCGYLLLDFLPFFLVWLFVDRAVL